MASLIETIDSTFWCVRIPASRRHDHARLPSRLHMSYTPPQEPGWPITVASPSGVPAENAARVWPGANTDRRQRSRRHPPGPPPIGPELANEHFSGAPSHPRLEGRQRVGSEWRVAPSHTDLRPARAFQARDARRSGRVARRLRPRGRCCSASQHDEKTSRTEQIGSQPRAHGSNQTASETGLDDRRPREFAACRGVSHRSSHSDAVLSPWTLAWNAPDFFRSYKTQRAWPRRVWHNPRWGPSHVRSDRTEVDGERRVYALVCGLTTVSRGRYEGVSSPTNPTPLYDPQYSGHN